MTGHKPSLKLGFAFGLRAFPEEKERPVKPTLQVVLAQIPQKSFFSTIFLCIYLFSVTLDGCETKGFFDL